MQKRQLQRLRSAARKRKDADLAYWRLIDDLQGEGVPLSEIAHQLGESRQGLHAKLRRRLV